MSLAHTEADANTAYIPSPEDEALAALILNADARDYWAAGWPDPLTLATSNDWDHRAELAYQSDRVARGPLF